MSDLDISEPIDIILCDGSPIVLSAMSETFEEDSRFACSDKWHFRGIFNNYLTN